LGLRPFLSPAQGSHQAPLPCRRLHSDRVSGLQRGGAVETFDYYLEVPPGQAQLVLQIFDADAGAGANLGTPAVNEDLHDESNITSSWTMTTTFELFDPNGASVAAPTMAG
jgi:hypothetical protein